MEKIRTFYAKHIANRSLRTQFFLCFMIVLIPITIILTYLSYNLAADVIRRKTEEQTTETVQQLSYSIDNYLTLMTNKLEILGNNPIVQEELTAIPDEVNRNEDSFYSRSKQIRRLMLQEYSSINMNDMEITGLNGAEYYISVNNIESDYDKDELNKMANASQGKWTLYNKDGDLMLAKLVKELQTGIPIGYVRFSLKRSYISKLTQDVAFGNNGSVILLDNQNDVITGTMPDELKERVVSLKGAEGTFDIRLDGNAYMAIYVRSGTSGWTTIGLVPYNYLFRDLKTLKNTVTLFSIVLILACIGLAQIIGRSFVRPIEDTEKALERFSTGDFSVRLSEDRGDEIGQMNRVFNKTVSDVQCLTQHVAQADILAREMEYKTLQSQMNPHFLYNTLDAINWMAFKKGDIDICNMVTAVSNLMRISISNKQTIITLEQELGYVKDYLFIQHVRYQNRFEAVYDIDDSLLKQTIPKLIIQPIVENSVVHGIESSEDTNIITVTAHKLDDHDIEICVEDTGVGMTKEKVDSLLSDQYADQGGENRYHTNLGMYAVNKRIKFLYGNEYGLSIESQVNVGTKVTIHIPYMDDPNELYQRYRNLLGEQKL